MIDSNSTIIPVSSRTSLCRAVVIISASSIWPPGILYPAVEILSFITNNSFLSFITTAPTPKVWFEAVGIIAFSFNLFTSKTYSSAQEWKKNPFFVAIEIKSDFFISI